MPRKKTVQDLNRKTTEMYPYEYVNKVIIPMLRQTSKIFGKTIYHYKIHQAESAFINTYGRDCYICALSAMYVCHHIGIDGEVNMGNNLFDLKHKTISGSITIPWIWNELGLQTVQIYDVQHLSCRIPVAIANLNDKSMSLDEIADILEDGAKNKTKEFDWL